MKKAPWILGVVMSLLAACDSSVSDSAKIATLSDAEARSVCEELAADSPKRTVACSGAGTVTIGVDAAECKDQNTDGLPDKNCDITVGEVRACSAALSGLTDAQLCSTTSTPAACTKFFACAGS